MPFARDYSQQKHTFLVDYITILKNHKILILIKKVERRVKKWLEK